MIFFSDFDGTITQADVTDRILEELADPAWREVEELWVRGLIGSHECLERQMALVNAPRKRLDALIDAIPVDPSFPAFYQFTRQQRIPFYVVSDGFDYVIRRILRRAGVDGELRNGRHLFASAMRVEDGRVRVAFPNSCSEHGCATCKAAVLRRVDRDSQPIIFAGDGLSDRFAVEETDIVFAKHQLLDYCRRQGIACHPFEAFAEIQARLNNVVDIATMREAHPATTLAK